MLNVALVVSKRALLEVFSLSLRVILANDTWNIEHLFNFIDLRLEMASNLSLRILELLLYFMFHPVLHDDFILLIIAHDIV